MPIQTFANAVRFAHSVASRFLSVKQPRLHSTESTVKWDELFLPELEVAQTAVEKWLWDDETPLVEVPLFRKPDSRPSGSIIVSTVKSLPPILSYSTEGATFAHLIKDYLAASLSTEEFDLKDLYLISPLEPIAKIQRRNSSTIEFITLPELRRHVLPSQHIEPKLLRRPIASWPEKQVEAAWTALDRPNDGPTGNAVIYGGLAAVKYQQACDAYPGGQQPGNANYCSPRKIAGCAPVAWAMLASSLKRRGQNKIWPGVEGWDTDWPSYGGDANPTMCPEVGQTIWGVHNAMGTTDGGATAGTLLLGGDYISQAFYLPRVKVPVAPGNPQPFDYGWVSTAATSDAIASTIHDQQKPLMFVGTGQWDALWTNLIVELDLQMSTPIRAPGPGDDGHCVVAYGLGGTSLFVTLGWGSFFPDRWIDTTSYPGAVIIFNRLW